MQCLICHDELTQVGSWVWCPNCNESYSPGDIDEMIHREEELAKLEN